MVFPGREDVSIVGEPVVPVTVAFAVPPPPLLNGKPVSNGLTRTSPPLLLKLYKLALLPS